jgi:hypothetical protein
MMRVISAAAVGAVAAALVALPAAAAAVPGAAPAPRHQHSLGSGAKISGGAALTSPNGRYSATISRHGRLLVRRGSHVVWHSFGRTGKHAVLRLRRSGTLTLRSGSRLLWSSATAGSHARRLLLTDKGSLELRSPGRLIWSSARGNLCRGGAGHGKVVSIDLSRQFAKLCDGDQQVLTTYVTSGATALGNGTPTGTWHLQGKQRDRYLYPAAGGAYYVHYWMPYNGDYGMHDSSWQKFPYGSDKYKTKGSHGCVHFPRAAIAWMFRWAPIGTTVRIHR